MLPDFNRLKIFYYIYKSKSTIDAAKKLNVTQSAISQHLKKLEKEIKMPLFIRLHKQLLPTQAGKQLFNTLYPFIKELEGTIEYINNASNEPCGTLRIGAPVEFGSKYLVQSLASFKKKYDQINFSLILGHPNNLLSLIKGNRLDLAFSDIFFRKSEFNRELIIFSIRPIINEKLILTCSKSYYDRYIKKDHSPKNLLRADFISYQPHCPAIRNWFYHHYNLKSINPNIALSVENVQTVISAIKYDMGMSVVPAYLIEKELKSHQLKKINTPKNEIINRISLVQLQDKIPTLAEKCFINHILNRIKSEGFHLD